MIQTCVVHLIRSSMRFVAYQDSKQVSAALKPIYTASSEDSALEGLAEFAADPWADKHPDTLDTLQQTWESFTPFLTFPPMLRRVVYTTNAIESLNYQLRKAPKNPDHPQQRSHRQTLVARNLQHRRPTNRRTRQNPHNPVPTPINQPPRRNPNHQLETNPHPTRRHQPRTNHPLPLTTTYTKHETLPHDVNTYSV